MWSELWNGSSHWLGWNIILYGSLGRIITNYSLCTNRFWLLKIGFSTAYSTLYYFMKWFVIIFNSYYWFNLNAHCTLVHSTLYIYHFGCLSFSEYNLDGSGWFRNFSEILSRKIRPSRDKQFIKQKWTITITPNFNISTNENNTIPSK